MAPKTKQPAVPPMTLGNTPVPSRKGYNGRFITVADESRPLSPANLV